eukprot:scaffold209989_cov55-Attheya_sp.AAC.1
MTQEVETHLILDRSCAIVVGVWRREVGLCWSIRGGVVNQTNRSCTIVIGVGRQEVNDESVV